MSRDLIIDDGFWDMDDAGCEVRSARCGMTGMLDAGCWRDAFMSILHLFLAKCFNDLKDI